MFNCIWKIHLSPTSDLWYLQQFIPVDCCELLFSQHCYNRGITMNQIQGCWVTCLVISPTCMILSLFLIVSLIEILGNIMKNLWLWSSNSVIKRAKQQSLPIYITEKKGHLDWHFHLAGILFQISQKRIEFKKGEIIHPILLFQGEAGKMR